MIRRKQHRAAPRNVPHPKHTLAAKPLRTAKRYNLANSINNPHRCHSTKTNSSIGKNGKWKMENEENDWCNGAGVFSGDPKGSVKNGA
ncbi:MAG: hypothetical protein KAV82_13610 [Phycisphaerae bacterium]|nr:hypothetical protein [Phycisphaerae bacterium]